MSRLHVAASLRCEIGSSLQISLASLPVLGFLSLSQYPVMLVILGSSQSDRRYISPHTGRMPESTHEATLLYYASIPSLYIRSVLAQFPFSHHMSVAIWCSSLYLELSFQGHFSYLDHVRSATRARCSMRGALPAWVSVEVARLLLFVVVLLPDEVSRVCLRRRHRWSRHRSQLGRRGIRRLTSG